MAFIDQDIVLPGDVHSRLGGMELMRALAARLGGVEAALRLVFVVLFVVLYCWGGACPRRRPVIAIPKPTHTFPIQKQHTHK